MEASCHTRTPPRTWLMPRNFSVLNQRSAIWPAMKGATIAPKAPTANMSPICAGENPLCPFRNGQSNGSQAPQIAYWRNIIVESLAFSPPESGFVEEESELIWPERWAICIRQTPLEYKPAGLDFVSVGHTLRACKWPLRNGRSSSRRWGAGSRS